MVILNMEQITLDAQGLWTAVLERDTNFDGIFVYAVRSTGVYCRPSCPSRRPRQAQAVFFYRPEEARSAGYRACKRCDPDHPCGDAELIQRACEFIDGHIKYHGALPSLAELTEASEVSVHALRRAFRQETGLTPMQYARGKRLKRFKFMLRDKANVTDALYDAGYGSSSRAYESVVKQIGMTPASYRKGGSGAVIRYVVTSSGLGEMLVAGTASGVCAVKLGDDAKVLITELSNEFPAADILPIESNGHDPECDTLWGWINAIREYLAGERLDIDLPIDVRATIFQWKVWRKLQTIPAGETRTYQQLAEELGQPSASRAVGQVCAANPVALIVPCHRALRKDGSLGGYRWGLSRKGTLLELERRESSAIKKAIGH